MAKGRGYGAKAADEPKPVVDKGKLAALKTAKAAGSPLAGGGRSTTGLDAVTVANISIRDRKGGEAFDKAFEALEREARRAERAR